MKETVKKLEVKLNRSLTVVNTEIDALKEPIRDFKQDIDQERQLMSFELERTRKLVLQQCSRPNVLTPDQ